MISAALIAILTYILGAYIIPRGSETRLDFENQYKKKKKVEYVRNVQMEVAEGVIAYIDRYEDYNKTGYRFSLDKFENKKLVSHLTARSIVYDSLAENKNQWKIRDYMIRELKGKREVITNGTQMDTIIAMQPRVFLYLKDSKKP